jgi:hypothetical protein
MWWQREKNRIIAPAGNQAHSLVCILTELPIKQKHDYGCIGKMRKKVVVTYFKVLFWNMSKGTEEKHTKSQYE